MHARNRSRGERQRGFTLVELMITVAIVGILAVIAYPSYTQFVEKGRRAEAKAALMENMQLFERHFAQVNTYAKDSATLGTIWTGYKPYSGDTATGTNFRITAQFCAGAASNADQCVELQAVPQKGDSACGTLVYRSTGQKLNIPNGGSTAVSTAGCW
jgi:type IV pilus assembly protein PilE